MLQMAEDWPASIVPLHPPEYVVVRGAITEMVLPPAFVTYMFPLFGLNAMPKGAEPTGMVDIKVFVEGFITETVLPPAFVTYMFPLFGLNAMPKGAEPTGMVDTAVFVEGFITETESLLKFVTYMFPLFGLKAMPKGAEPAGSGIVFATNPCGGLFSVT